MGKKGGGRLGWLRLVNGDIETLTRCALAIIAFGVTGVVVLLGRPMVPEWLALVGVVTGYYFGAAAVRTQRQSDQRSERATEQHLEQMTEMRQQRDDSRRESGGGGPADGDGAGR